jgi:hypothetical protein
MGHLAHQVKEIYFALFSALKASASPRATANSVALNVTTAKDQAGARNPKVPGTFRLVPTAWPSLVDMLL